MTSANSDSLVLITGASGYLGYRAVVNALEAGYHVRAAIRSQAKADVVLNAPSVKALSPGSKLDFIFVPDILADGAYDEAVKGVKYVIHIASPVARPSEDPERDIIEPAVKGTTGILKSAAKSPSVKRIVITSSIIAVIPWNEFIMVESDQVFTADDTVPDEHGPFVHYFQVYGASKANALNATKRFMETERPGFDVQNIMPSFFIGKNELTTDAADILNNTSGVAFGPVLGKKSDSANPGAQSHVDDVAKVHVLALNPKVEGGQNFGMRSNGVAGSPWDDSIEIVKKRFPEAVKDGRLPLGGKQPSKRLLYDTSRTEKILGIKFRTYEDQVVSVAEHYLDLLEKAGGNAEDK
ncbi:hypothetical protein MMC28_001648 [Mycoblastus sanguinarius]|nr:hypothetical protein [Mycoblastus sanguinarius]